MEDDAKPRDLEDRTFRFAESVRTFVKQLPRTVSNAEDESDARDASHSQSTACEMQLKRHYVLSRRRGTFGVRTRPRVAFAFFGI